MGYFAQPAGSFALFVNDEKVIDIRPSARGDAVWASADNS
jgi:hypothetical protein